MDNESARVAAIKAYSPVMASTRILAEISRFDYIHQTFPWYARVSTYSNIGDAPSLSLEPSVVLPRADRIVYPIFGFADKPARYLKQG